MECRIDGNAVRKGLTFFLEKQMNNSGLFRPEGNIFRATQPIPEVTNFVNGINSKFGKTVIEKVSSRNYTISIPDTIVKDYIVATEEGKDIVKFIGLHNSFYIDSSSKNEGEIFTFLAFPEITEMTNDALKTFLLKLNPKFRVEEVDNLSNEGVTYIKDFLIRIKSGSRLSAMPEEVAHVFRLMLPDDNTLKKEMFDNITSFPIYNLTLEKYKTVYTKEDGTPDYNKIKWEAADKLVAEYVTAISTNNYERVEVLTKIKQGFIKKWLYKFLKWLGLGILENTHFYKDAAGIILSGEVDMTLKNEKDINDISFTDSFFYKTSETEAQEKYYLSAVDIMEKVENERLVDIVTRFSKDFGNKYREILNDEKYKDLETELRKQGNEVKKINKLLEIKSLLSDARYDLRNVADADVFLKGFKQFLEAIDKLDLLSAAIVNVINNKEKVTEFDKAIENIKELENYFSLYETFNTIINADFASILVSSKVGADVVESILRTQRSFDIVNRYILDHQKDNLLIFYKEMLKDSNKNALDTLNKDLELAEKLGNIKIVEEIRNKIKTLIITDDNIIAMLSGKGKDIDAFSNLNHLVNASIVNGDQYLSGVTKYIQSKLKNAQGLATITINDLSSKIDAIIKGLNEPAHITGKFISYVDKVYDRQLGEERSVLRWLNPFNGIEVDLEKYRKSVQDSLQKYITIDKNNETEKAAAFEVYKEARQKYSDFLQKFYNRPFAKEYYEFRDKYEKNPDFVDIIERYRELTDIIKGLEEYLRVEPENTESWKELAMHKRERANLSNEYDLRGNLKAESELKKVQLLKDYFQESGKYKEVDELQTQRSFHIYENRYIQKVEFAIQKVREAKPKNIEEVEEKLRLALREPRLRIVNSYLLKEGDEKVIDYDFIKEILTEKFYAKSILVQKNDKYFEDEKKLREELDQLQKKGELTDIDIQIKEAYDELYRLTYGSRDESGQINPASLIVRDQNDNEDTSVIDRIVELEDLLVELKKDRPSSNVFPEDMTPEDRDTYERMMEILRDPTSGPGQRFAAIKRKNSIARKYKNQGKNKRASEIINELGALSAKVPTDYYWDRIETFIHHFYEFGKEVLQLQLTEEERNSVLEFAAEFEESIDGRDFENLDFNVFTKGVFGDFLEWLKENKNSQYEWFMNNHKEKRVFDHANKKYIPIPYARIAIYENAIPVKEEHQKLVFSKKFTKFRVKDEYRTGYNPTTKKVELKVGVHTSNRESNGLPEFLPLLPEQGAPKDSPYINKEYYRLKDSQDPKDKLRFQYLEILKEIDLQHQNKLPSNLRRWMNVPVMNMSNIEEIKNLPQYGKQKLELVKGLLKKTDKSDALEQDSGISAVDLIDETTQLIMNDKLPRLGMAQKLPVENVSRDLLKSVNQFIIKSHEFESRTEVSPVIQALIRVMDYSERNQDGKRFREGTNKQRLQIFEKVFSQMILQEVPDSPLNSRRIRSAASFITGNTALKMLFDPIGGVINYGSAMVNNIIEATSGKYVNLKELGKGKYLAGKLMASLTADFGKRSGLSYNTLLFQTFDFLQGDFEEDLLDRSSSLDKWASVQQLAMIPRKAGELMAQSALALGMMERVRVKNSIDGQEYPAHEIYEVKNNNLSLKKGFPEEWTPVTGEKFIKLRDLIHRVNLELHGNYAKINATEASRHAIGKLAENMKRWFMPAIQRRFGRETIDVTFEDLNEGYYITTGKALANYFGSLFKGDFTQASSALQFYLKSPRYKYNLARAGAEAAQALLLFLTFALLLGYSGDDKNKELDENSWIHNTAILITLRIYSETTAYIPFPGLGYQELRRNALSPFTLPADAVSNMAALGQLGLFQIMYWFGADSLKDWLYYEKDSGYWFSEEGDSKFMKYLLNTFGVNGYTMEPAQYIKTYDTLQKRLK